MSAARRPARRGIVASLAIAALAAAAAVGLLRPGPGPQLRPPGERPALMLITTLPLIFADEFRLEGGGSKALAALETRYRVVPVGVADAAALEGGSLLLMAHPLAQPAEALADLDDWVRRGGRLLLLADPRLDWPSERPLGDRLRPPPAFADTGLLAHWGLKLEGPDPEGPAQRTLGGMTILAVSPGSLSGACAIGSGGFVAHCRVGKGHAAIVADADFLNVEGLDGPTDRNLEALLAVLASLERGFRESRDAQTYPQGGSQRTGEEHLG